MQSSRRVAWILLAVLAAGGCGSKPAVEPAAPGARSADVSKPASGSGTVQTAESQPAATSAAATTSSPAVNPPAVPPAPSAEQIARWAVADYQPFELLDCRDGFHDPAVFGMSLSTDGKQFVLAGAKLTLWNTKYPQPVAELLKNYTSDDVERPVQGVAISADGKWLAFGDQKGRVRLLSLKEQHEELKLQAHDGHITLLTFSPDSKLLATTSYDGEVRVWELPSGKQLKSLKTGDQELDGLVFLSDGSIATAGKETAIWDVADGTKKQTLTTKSVITPALGLSPDRQTLAFNDADSAVQFWDVPQGKPKGIALKGAGAQRMAFSHDGKWLATYGQNSDIRIWDLARGSVVQVIDADGGRTAEIAWLPGDQAMVIASIDDRVRVWGAAGAAKSLGIQPIKLPALQTVAEGEHRSLSSAQWQGVMDVRSFPRMPGAVSEFGEFGMAAYVVDATQAEAELFYRYRLGQAGWTELPGGPSQGGLVFRKDGCQLLVSMYEAPTGGANSKPALHITVSFSGNYDVRWLAQILSMESNSNYASFSSVSYRSKASLTDVEVAALKQFHAAGWTAYSRLASSGREDPVSRSITMLQGGSTLNVSIGYPADSKEELYVQVSVGVTNKSLPIPPDAGWIEFDNSTDMQFVINTKMNLEQTAKFFDEKLAAEGWLRREAGRLFKDDKAWLPYVRGEQDLFLRLSALKEGGTQIVAGDAASSSWQLREPPKAPKQSDQPGVQAADIKLPGGATAVNYDVDEKQINFEMAGTTPKKLSEQFAPQMESLGWKRGDRGIVSDEYVLMTFTNTKPEINFRASASGDKTTASISGDGLLWSKPLPTAPVRISYETWLRRKGKQATLDSLDDFAAEMQKIPASKPEK